MFCVNVTTVTVATAPSVATAAATKSTLIATAILVEDMRSSLLEQLQHLDFPNNVPRIKLTAD